jgi:hypothetical protein
MFAANFPLMSSKPGYLFVGNHNNCLKKFAARHEKIT